MTTFQLVDGLYEEMLDDSFHISQALTAAGGPLYPPDEWFRDPGLNRPTPITITADGRIYGHIAPWEVSHIGMPPGTKPPRSASDYAFFKTGVVMTDSKREVPVGQLTLAGGHAAMNAGAGEAVKHYDDTNSAIADITCGEDNHGIWISGGLRPGVTDEQVRALRASAPSGDWRPINNSLELVAICQVNTPGFPVARAMVAGGELTALVAAGASEMYELQQENLVLNALQNVAERVSNLEALVAASRGDRRGDLTPLKEKTRLYPTDRETQKAMDDGDKPFFAEKTRNADQQAPVADGKTRKLKVQPDSSGNVLILVSPDTLDGGTGDLDDIGTDNSMFDFGDGEDFDPTMDVNGAATNMDDDGDFDSDANYQVPDVTNYDGLRNGYTDNTSDASFEHAIDECPGDGCTNPAHTKGGMVAASKSKKDDMESGDVSTELDDINDSASSDDTDNSIGISRDGNDVGQDTYDVDPGKVDNSDNTKPVKIDVSKSVASNRDIDNVDSAPKQIDGVDSANADTVDHAGKLVPNAGVSEAEQRLHAARASRRSRLRSEMEKTRRRMNA